MSAGGWTGGQFSLLRAWLGLALAVGFARSLPWAAELYSSDGVLAPAADGTPGLLHDPASARVLVGIGALLAVSLALGLRRRWAALGLWGVLAGLAARNPATVDSGTAFLGWVCLALALAPRAPFGSLDARGRLDPGGDWRMPVELWTAAWVVLSGTTAYSGLVKLARPEWRAGTALERLVDGPLGSGPLVELVAGLPGGVLAAVTWAVLGLQLAFAPLSLWGRARPWLWGAMVAASVGVLFVTDSPDAGFGRLALLGLCFAPAWVPGAAGHAVETVFYDGHCGLCHRAVRSVLAEDRRDAPRFRFAPIDGETFRETVPAALRDRLPDSVLVLTADGELLDRSRAALRLMARLGGLWRLLAIVAEAVPLALRDSLYDAVARVRHRLFAAPEEACPLLPPELRARFLP